LKDHAVATLLSGDCDKLSIQCCCYTTLLDATRQKLQQQREAMRTSMESDRARFEQAAAQKQSDVKMKGQELRTAVDGHFATVRTKVAEHRAEHDRRSAERYAEHAEKDASVAVDFALYALDQADYLITEAAIARADADEFAAQS
ncbi:hypothetical protein ACIRRA_43905, partial [Nocardia sp. NPDC101769]|uniref:hypothetical protein n=1 Tax=Nocardia sp. NPDC101769 TaxID=3364333 RepID=UPI00380465FE